MGDRSMTPRRAEIVAVAGHLFAERGYHGASLRDIGDEAGMRRGSLYAHFESKEEILRLVVEPALDELEALLAEVLAAEGEGEAVGAMEGAIRAAVAACVRRRDALLIVLQDRLVLEETPSLRELSDQAMAVTGKWVEAAARAQAEGSLRQDLAPETIVFGLYGLLLAVLSDRHLGLQRRDVLPTATPALADLVLDLFMDGARPR